ncbi:MAG: hypothetical protein ACD_51C00016G0002 [uncultured bacterium]|nr:MAG: hypothetical protein ACD_51C00016G0002 [uncultured bacterium]OGJ47244.1 MAG: hypothetical protein A2244_00150 [Candidatus Peregrinibacteria bacterium RIFOXYA2_FULL_41_18]OGJ49688.1 MAG: hypothetical protein A2344_02115 [Candidatus Peregrinibacteria bacterium RIFOXYB12_FULL_41_12]OGJ53500.1 MAG: hypothetical protein A2448_02355 [Candidatus Peregrinibacteria bacterium RIFOXYC2_FULL_41_22]
MKILKTVGLLAVFIIAIFFIRKLPVFISYTFWEEWGPNDYWDGGYQLGFSDFHDALTYTTNDFIDFINYGLLMIYGSLPVLLISKMFRKVKA